VAVDTVGDSVAGLALVTTGDIAVTAGDVGIRDSETARQRDSAARLPDALRLGPRGLCAAWRWGLTRGHRVRGDPWSDAVPAGPYAVGDARRGHPANTPRVSSPSSPPGYISEKPSTQIAYTLSVDVYQTASAAF
jgi:hypothetical protein